MYLTIGFTSASPMFDFIDVGAGKECADFKIREHAKQFSSISQCKKVVLGCMHDASYIPDLIRMKTEGKDGKIMMLRGGASRVLWSYCSQAFFYSLQQYRLVGILLFFLSIEKAILKLSSANTSRIPTGL